MTKLFRPSPQSFKNTFCVFQEVLPEVIEGLTKQFESKSGSCYFYTQEGMYRSSNHWGRLANSKWRLLPLEPETPIKTKLGFARWDSFYPDNANESLYYLAVDYAKKTVTYEHKSKPDCDANAVLRTSLETSKKIKQIRNLFALSSWAKHFEYDDLDVLRRQIIEQLIYTTKTLEEIKRTL